MALVTHCDCAGCTNQIAEVEAEEHGWILVVDGGTHHFCSWAHVAEFSSSQVRED